jgi:hypothetical protein
MSLSRRSVLAGLALSFAPARAAAPDTLVAAYPEFLARATATSIIWRDGTLMAWSDGRPQKTFIEKVADPSLADQMALVYPRGAQTAPPPRDFDPGRFRNLAFFKKMYGASAAEVERSLVPVPWHIGDYRADLLFTRVNGVDHIVRRLVGELAALPAELHRYLVPPGGSFVWRDVARTERLSAHAFGIAVDINPQFSDYWRWRSGWHNRIPAPIVEIFERHGFIWGGRWFHHDTMHFEYRPELFA